SRLVATTAGQSVPRVFPYRLEDYSLAGSAVHDDSQRRVESHMADTSVFIHGWLLAQPLPINRAFSGIWIDREVADLESGKVLEEMAALRRRNAKISEAGFPH